MQLQKFHVVVFQMTQVQLLFFPIIQPIKFSVFGVVIAVAAVDHVAPCTFLQRRAERVPGAGAWPREGRMVRALFVVVISTQP